MYRTTKYNTYINTKLNKCSEVHFYLNCGMAAVPMLFVIVETNTYVYEVLPISIYIHIYNYIYIKTFIAEESNISIC